MFEIETQPVVIGDEQAVDALEPAQADNASDVLIVINRRTLNYLIIALVLLSVAAVAGMVIAARQNDDKLAEMNAPKKLAIVPGTEAELFDQVRAQVLPEEGITLPIRWGSWLPRLVEEGVIDMEKFETSFASRGGLTEEQTSLLTRGSNDFITINNENSWFLVTVLWPLGLSNQMDINEASPINGERLFNFASTGGWSLGREENGEAYFNKYDLIPLTAEQEALVKELAENSYRPCCNNSTFFQDCNHGSGLLGLLELGAYQGLTRNEIARAALAANSFWFPQNYVTTAMYLKAVRELDWKDVNPEEILGFEYSSATGANAISQEAARLNLLPENAAGAQCGVR